MGGLGQNLAGLHVCITFLRLLPVSLICADSMAGPQFKIEPFKYPVKMDPNFAGMLASRSLQLCTCGTVASAQVAWLGAEKTWAVLESAIHEIFNQNQSGLSFEELYRSAQ